MKFNSDDWLPGICFVGLPLLAMVIIGACSYYLASVSSISPWLAVPVGLVCGGLFLGAGIASSGTDMMDFAVTSIITIILTLGLMPTFLRARDNAHKQFIKRALQEHGAIYPQPQWKGTQRNR